MLQCYHKRATICMLRHMFTRSRLDYNPMTVTLSHLRKYLRILCTFDPRNTGLTLHSNSYHM